jgi:hypothetical protein
MNTVNDKNAGDVSSVIRVCNEECFECYISVASYRLNQIDERESIFG